MLIAMLSLAGMCAEANFCPGIDALRRAVQKHDDETTVAMSVAADSSPDRFALIEPRRVTRVSGVYCDAPADTSPRSVSCTITVHYGRDRSFRIVELQRDGTDWRVIDQRAVYRHAPRD